MRKSKDAKNFGAVKEEKALCKNGCALAGTANEVWRGCN